MTITEKYGFASLCDHFGNPTPPWFVEESELHIIAVFEREMLALKQEKEHCTMVELGSNQAYYSLLFKHIIGKDRTKCIMLEPTPEHMERSHKAFELNGCTGTYYRRGIGSRWVFKNFPWGTDLTVEPMKLRELLYSDTDIIDVLHCDIDGSECLMLDDNKDIFEAGLVDRAFVYTHIGHPDGLDRHQYCKDFFSRLPRYVLVDEWRRHDHPEVGTDDHLVYKLKR